MCATAAAMQLRSRTANYCWIGMLVFFAGCSFRAAGIEAIVLLVVSFVCLVMLWPKGSKTHLCLSHECLSQECLSQNLFVLCIVVSSVNGSVEDSCVCVCCAWIEVGVLMCSG
jgi:hypothetical protein